MDERTLTDVYKGYARQVGADLVGIAARKHFESVPADQNPAAVFPQYKAVIVLGRRIARGSLRGVEEGTNFHSTYSCFGLNWLEDQFLSQTTYNVNIRIEEDGYEAVPLFGYHADGMPKGVPVAADKPAPNVYVDPWFAARAAGLGEVGLGGFFITPQYGTRQRFAMILTDADLKPDPVSSRQLCRDCRACVEACPFGAIDPEAGRCSGVPQHETALAAIDYSICNQCPNGAVRCNGKGSRPDRIAAACGRACLVRLEQSGQLANRFEQPFRKRSPWLLDMCRRDLSVEART